jgi:capsular exopolysaccharide synthesis family protein
MVASPSPAEGKSTILSNLAVANVFTGLRVLVIDADLRRPTIHSIFKVPRETAGLSNYLSDPKIDVKEVISATAIGVDIVTSGPIPPNPAELLSSPRMNSMIGHAKSSYDVVFVDSPPLLVVADGPIIASQVHGVVVVVDAFETRPSALRGALRLINDSGGDVVGVVINKHRNKFMRTGYYYYQYHDYGYDTYYYENGADTPQNGLSGRIKKMWSRIGPSD